MTLEQVRNLIQRLEQYADIQYTKAFEAFKENRMPEQAFHHEVAQQAKKTAGLILECVSKEVS